MIQIEHEAVHKIESIANDNERKLIRELGFLEEILDFLGIVIVAFPTDSLHLPYLTSTRCSLYILEMHFRIFAEIDNRAKIVVETCPR